MRAKPFVSVMCALLLLAAFKASAEPVAADTQAKLDDPVKKALDSFDAIFGPTFGNASSLKKESVIADFVKNPRSFKGRRLIADYFQSTGEDLPPTATILLTGGPKLVLNVSSDGLLPPHKGNPLPKLGKNYPGALLVFDCKDGELEKGNQVVNIIPIRVAPEPADFVDNTRNYANCVVYFTGVTSGYREPLRMSIEAKFGLRRPNADFIVRVEPRFTLARFRSVEDLPNIMFLDQVNVWFYCGEGKMDSGNWAIEIKRFGQ